MSTYRNPTYAFRVERKKMRDRVSRWAPRGRSGNTLKTAVDTGLMALRGFLSDSSSSMTASVSRDLYRDFLESLDAVDIALQHGAVGAARTLGRTCLEQGALLKYVLKRNDERISWTKELSEWDREEVRLRQIREWFRSNPSFWDPLEAEKMDKALEEGIKNLRYERIKAEKSEYASVKAWKEFKDLAEYEERKLSWYACFDGPRSVQQLFRTVEWSHVYESFYSPWSERAHGSMTASREDGGDYPIRPLRFFSREEFESVTEVLFCCWGSVLYSMQLYFRPATANHDMGEESENRLRSLGPGFDF